VSALLLEAERVKLARVLHATPEALAFLEPLGVDGLRALRERASAALFDEYRPMFQRIANSGRILPVALIAFLSQKVFGPWISARTAGLMAVDRAVEVQKKLPVAFQADLCLQLDPRSARELLRRLPVPAIVEVGRVMLQRKEYVTMARFVDCLTDEAIRAVSRHADDDALLLIGFYVESEHALSASIGLLPPERLRGIVRRTIEGPAEVQHAGLATVCKVNDKVKGLMGNAAAALGDPALAGLMQRLRADHDDAVLEAMIAGMSPELRGRAQALLRETAA
jgi:hypothetical protein